uniref:Uncharacterized protein n=1 Tax=Utricularia reniformis TaxID=192314 RepID=A0A1Y0B1S2_9LAMI|nr:hypothetical protein AEK19_MT1183 [Utricularia reniformis]ART31396.1 hypothetical protein AEK19_MT1183 [Utricularia reniformis]
MKVQQGITEQQPRKEKRKAKVPRNSKMDLLDIRTTIKKDMNDLVLVRVDHHDFPSSRDIIDQDYDLQLYKRRSFTHSRP